MKFLHKKLTIKKIVYNFLINTKNKVKNLLNQKLLQHSKIFDIFYYLLQVRYGFIIIIFNLIRLKSDFFFGSFYLYLQIGI